METTRVNWGALDALVMDYAETEGLLEPLPTAAEELMMPKKAQFEIRCKINDVRTLVHEGRIPEALDAIKECMLPSNKAPQDQRLLFRLYKQKFLELLRTGIEDRRREAIECSRNQLGPCALDAYPEAYKEFKRTLLALIYDKDDQASPIAEEWSEARRVDLAASVTSLLTAQLHAHDHIFSLALRYLVSIHNSYYLRKGEPSPIAQLADQLLLKERDPQWTPQECLLEAPRFNEGDVQALAHAVIISRQEAVDSLRCTDGDVIAALKNELNRMKLNGSLLDEIVKEYCTYRGLIEGSFSKLSLPGFESSNLIMTTINDEPDSKKGGETQEVSNSTVDMEMDSPNEPERISKLNQEGYSVITGEDFPSTKLEEGYTHIGGFGQRHFNCEASEGPLRDEIMGESCASESGDRVDDTRKGNMNNESFCSTSTSQSHFSMLAALQQRIGRKKGKSFAPLRKWRGRIKGHSQASDGMGKFEAAEASVDLKRCGEMEVLVEEEKSTDARNNGLKTHPQESQPPEFESYAATMEIKELASKGLINEAIEEVQCLNPSFFEQNPHFLFSMKQAEFLKLVEDGEYKHAVGVARSVLGPLAVKHPDLLRPLKETILALAHPQGEAPIKPTPISMLAASLQVALGASLGIAEPLLMKIVRVLIYCHIEWFKLQMCSDSFADSLSINALKEADEPAVTSTSAIANRSTNMECSAEQSLTTGNPSGSEGSSSQHLDLSPLQPPRFSETSILTVMEWMAVSRRDAIQLLAQYDGSVEDVFAHLVT